MKADEEIAKAKARKQDLSPAAVKLERAREKALRPQASKAERKAFRDAQDKVVAERRAERRKREAEGPPEAAPGDAVVRLGGAA